MFSWWLFPWRWVWILLEVSAPAAWNGYVCNLKRVWFIWVCCFPIWGRYDVHLRQVWFPLLRRIWPLFGRVWLPLEGDLIIVWRFIAKSLPLLPCTCFGINTHGAQILLKRRKVEIRDNTRTPNRIITTNSSRVQTTPCDICFTF